MLTRINLANTIIDVARTEDLLMRRVGQGIFSIPELAFVHTVGRTIASRATQIFGTSDVRWLPEIALESGSRTDLVFEVQNGRTYAFEFKRTGAVDTWVRDLEKLGSLTGDYERIFCALVDAWPDQLYSDPRITAIERSNVRVERLVDHFDFFSTLDFRYKNQICCVVAMWVVTHD